MEIEVAQILLNITNDIGDIKESLGEVKGTQNTIMWVMGIAVAAGGSVIGYLAHCVYTLGTQINKKKLSSRTV